MDYWEMLTSFLLGLFLFPRVMSGSSFSGPVLLLVLGDGFTLRVS